MTNAQVKITTTFEYATNSRTHSLSFFVASNVANPKRINEKNHSLVADLMRIMSVRTRNVLSITSTSLKPSGGVLIVLLAFTNVNV